MVAEIWSHLVRWNRYSHATLQVLLGSSETTDHVLKNMACSYFISYLQWAEKQFTQLFCCEKINWKEGNVILEKQLISEVFQWNSASGNKLRQYNNTGFSLCPNSESILTTEIKSRKKKKTKNGTCAWKKQLYSKLFILNFKFLVQVRLSEFIALLWKHILLLKRASLALQEASFKSNFSTVLLPPASPALRSNILCWFPSQYIDAS